MSYNTCYIITIEKSSLEMLIFLFLFTLMQRTPTP
nr:MAG TPA: hypothetical protein [Caudoviricetes sp.]